MDATARYYVILPKEYILRERVVKNIIARANSHARNQLHGGVILLTILASILVESSVVLWST